MTLKYLLVVFLTLFSRTAEGQNNKIEISGRVDQRITKLYSSDELSIRVNKTCNQQSQGKRFFVSIDSAGYFKTQLFFKDTIVYLSFEFEEKTESNFKGSFRASSLNMNRPMEEVYMFQCGDSVNVDIRNDGRLLFAGRGSEKLTCQSLIYNIDPIPYSVNFRLSDLSGAKESLLLMESSIRGATQLRLNILLSYKTQLSTGVYNLLYADAIASAEYAFLRRLASSVLYRSISDTKFVQQYYETYLLERRNLEANIPQKDASIYYPDMIFLREFLSFDIRHRTKVIRKLAFKEIYERILNNYSKKLRDKLLFICFERLIPRYSTEAIPFAVDALNAMNVGYYREHLANLIETQKKAFPFSRLYDAEDKEHKLSEYQGKLVIIDFWFTGCTPCILLAKAMHPVFEKYRENKNIVFLTISTDNKGLWLKSVASGLYNSKGMINLHTNGLGFNHPLIKHYNFKGFPQQLIIDKNGQLISSAPIRPMNNENKQLLIRQINDALKEDL